jgi:quinol monooxygenase YgiN
LTAQIVITGWIDYEPTERADVLKQFSEVARISRKESGCIDYAVSADPDDERRVRVFEHWVSDAALDAHFKTRHVTTFRAAIADKQQLGRLLLKHVIASSAPMKSSSQEAR